MVLPEMFAAGRGVAGPGAARQGKGPSGQREAVEMAKKIEETKVEATIRGPSMVRMPVTIRGIEGSSYVPNQIATRDTRATKNAPGSGKQRDKRQDDPEQCARDCLYLDDDGRECIPASALQKAIVTEPARGYVEGFKGTYVAGAVNILAPRGKIPIKGKWVVDSRHARRPARTGAPTMVHRPRYDEWEATFDVLYDEKAISGTDVLHLLAGAGVHVGIGDGRKEKNGPFGGMFVVVE